MSVRPSDTRTLRALIGTSRRHCVIRDLVCRCGGGIVLDTAYVCTSCRSTFETLSELVTKENSR